MFAQNGFVQQFSPPETINPAINKLYGFIQSVFPLYYVAVF
jgi:hypothetical protein